MRRLLITAVLGCLLLPAAAWASGNAVIKDCTDDGVIQGHYSQQDYKDALNNLPTDVDEYTDCRDVIKRAQTGGTGGGSGGPGAPGGTGGGPARGDPLASATPAQRAPGAAAPAGGNKPGHLGGTLLPPGKAGVGGARPPPPPPPP